MMKIKYLLIGLVAFLLSSCASKKLVNSSADEMLSNSTWQIVELDGKQIKDKVNGKTPYLVLDLNENHYSVVTGCNTLNGEFDLSKNKLKFFNGMSTMMYCDDMSVEDGFKSVLSKISSYKIQGNELVLLDGDKAVAKLTKEVIKKNVTLEGTSWELDLISEPGVDFEKLFSAKKPNLVFLEGSRLSGNASCNRFNTTYKIDGNNISLGNIMSTKMMCENIEGERVFLNTLSKINRFSESDSQLLFMIDDIVTMRFKKI